MRTARQWREFIAMLGRPPNWIEESLMFSMEELERQVGDLVRENRGLKQAVREWQGLVEGMADGKLELERRVEELEDEKQGFGRWKLKKGAWYER